MSRRIVLIGATGAFGARLAERLTRWSGVTLVLAARRSEPLEALASALEGPAMIEIATLDRERPEALAALRPWAVVDAAGPFQASDYRLPLAAVDCGAHYVDLADARDFVAGFEAALDARAKAAGVVAVTGASSTPALSNAAVEALSAGWTRIDRIGVAISPGARAPRGLSVVQAILSYAGQPLRTFTGGAWRDAAGWSGPRRIDIPGLGRRWVSLCETPDLDLLPQRFAPTGEGVFRAGLELSAMHLGLWLLTWLVRLRLVRSLRPMARVLRAMAGWLERLGGDRGGMLVEVEGADAQGQARRGRWWLTAKANAGPTVPTAAACAMLRALDRGGVRPMAGPCVGLLTLDEIVAELTGLPIATEARVHDPQEPVLFRRLLGDAFNRLSPTVQALHGASAAAAFEGAGRARGDAGLPALARAVLGLPHPGRYPRLLVSVRPFPGGERWTRAFGDRRFTSLLMRQADPGQFQERFGPIRFVFDVVPGASGFTWRFLRWSLGPLPMPRALAPRIRARAGEAQGRYRFSVVVTHPFVGVLFAYAGWLEPARAA